MDKVDRTCLISVHLPGGGRGEDRPDQPDPNKQHRPSARNISRSTEKCEIDYQCQSLQVMYILTAMALLKKAVAYNTLKCIGLTNAIHIYFNSFFIILSQRRLEKPAPDSAWSLDCAGELSKFAENTFYLPFQLVRQGLPSSLS